LTPDATLSPNRLYRAYLSYGNYFYDLSGNRINRTTTTFTTGDRSTILPPTVLGNNLSADTTAVPLNAAVKLTFDRLVNGICINDSSVALSDSIGTVAGNAILSANNLLLTFGPKENLLSNAAYTIDLVGVCGLTGQVMSDYSFGFTTGSAVDTGRPSATAVSPAHQSIDTALDSTILVEFNDVLDPVSFANMVVSNNIRVYDAFDVNISGSWSVAGNMAEFTPSGLLPGSSRINIRFDRYALLDQVGNTNSSLYSYYFDTGIP